MSAPPRCATFPVQCSFGPIARADSNYSFANVELSKATVSADDSFSVKLDITNHGSMAGKAVVQVYFTQDLSSRVRYEHMLLGFGKVEVAGGATVKGAQVELKARDLEMWDKRADKYVVEASTYSLAVGQFVSDPAMHTTTLTVTA